MCLPYHLTVIPGTHVKVQSENQHQEAAPTKEYTWNDRPMVLATYVAEDGLVRHQWEEMPLGPEGVQCPPPPCREVPEREVGVGKSC